VIVTHGHPGARSMTALLVHRGAGCGGERSLAGGIDAWADRVEVGMARY
jgi:rhodanese-related sulfurtransferase